VVLQDNDPRATNSTRALAKEIYARLARGARPSAIPVHVWVATRGGAGSLALPSLPPLANARRNAVILLIDQQLFNARKEWHEYFEALNKVLSPDRDLLLPVSICADAHRVSRRLANVNSVPVTDPEAVPEDERIFQAILTAILRLLPETHPESPISSDAACVAIPPRVFLCHAKSDGDGLARGLRQYIYEQTQLICFFDTHDIPHGRGVRDFIRTSITDSCLLVVWTDRLLDSRWCQYEILEARRQQRPLLVLEALSRQAARIFPFLTNMPVVRWRDNPAEVLSALLLELVRTRHIRALFDSLCTSDPPKPGFMLHPPDIMEASSVLRPRFGNPPLTELANQLVVYPDPPLPAEELAFLHDAFPTLHLHSLSEWTALRAAGALPDPRESPTEERKAPLSQLCVGLSVSETESWKDLGLIAEHQEDFVMDGARVNPARRPVALGRRSSPRGHWRAIGSVGASLSSSGSCASRPYRVLSLVAGFIRMSRQRSYRNVELSLTYYVCHILMSPMQTRQHCRRCVFPSCGESWPKIAELE
jgi:hypothetical protein